jgi:hypothetical protein
MQVLLEAFPDVRDNKGVIPDENIKWFILYTHRHSPTLQTLILKMEAPCASKMLATLLTSMQCKDP